MVKSIRAARRAALAVLLLSAACTDRSPTEITPPPGEPVRTEIACTVTVADARMRCDVPASAGGASASVMLGGQGTYVRLESTNLAYDSDADVFSVDVTVQNLLSQQMGTPDGVTATGVKVFFEQMPTATVGSGPITILNQDGEGTFTQAMQPYFEYPEILEPLGTSAPRPWRFGVPGTVERFGFKVYVSTELPAEQGVLRWIQEEGPATAPLSHLWGMWGTSATDVFAVGAQGRILHLDGTRWRPMATGTRAWLYGVWGSSRSRVFAVGDSGTVLRYDGNRWSRLSGPVTGRSLRGIWGRNDTLWVAGYQRDAQARTHGLILRSTDGGGSWTEIFSTPEVGNRQLWGITGTSGGALVITGLQTATARGVNDAVVLRSLDGGETWTEQIVSEPTHRTLYRVWSQGNDLVAVGQAQLPDASGYQAFMMRSSDGGQSWTRETHPGATALYGVWGSAPGDVTGVGLGGSILHFDGSAWTEVSPAGATENMFAVWGSSAGDVFAAGDRETLARRTAGGWSLVPAAGDRALDYVDAWGPAPGDLYVIARSYDYETNRWGTALLRRTDGSWSTVRPREEDLELKSLWGSGPNQVFAVGTRWTGSRDEGVLLHYDGVSWTETVSAAEAHRRFNAVHGDGAGNVWVVGIHWVPGVDVEALLRHSTDGGRNWTEHRIYQFDHTLQLFDVWAAGPSEVYAVGSDFHRSTGIGSGLRLRFDGTEWHRTSETVPSGLGVVWGTGDGTVYAGGYEGDAFSGSASGLIMVSADSGKSWTRNTFAPTFGNVREVNAFWSPGPGTVYAAGSGGPMLQLDGEAWEPVGPLSASIFTLWGFSATDVWALGAAGAVYHGTR